MNIIFFAFIARCSLRHPIWHKRESAFCVCQRLSRSSARVLHSDSPSLKGIHTLCVLRAGYMCRSCQKKKMIVVFSFFSAAAVAATVNMRLNKEAWQKQEHLYDSRSRSESLISWNCHFFLTLVNDYKHFVASASSGGAIDWMSNCHPALVFAYAASVLSKFTTTAWVLAPLVIRLFTERETAGLAFSFLYFFFVGVLFRLCQKVCVQLGFFCVEFVCSPSGCQSLISHSILNLFQPYMEAQKNRL